MLRTNTKEEMDEALLTSGLVTEVERDGQTTIYPIQHIYIDHIGPISKPAITEEFEGEMVLIAPGSVDNRWHTNVRACIELTEEQIAALPQVDPPPAIPYRVFA